MNPLPEPDPVSRYLSKTVRPSQNEVDFIKQILSAKMRFDDKNNSDNKEQEDVESCLYSAAGRRLVRSFKSKIVHQ